MESLYIPQHHAVDDREFLYDFIDRFPFADLVTAAPSIRITHIPVLLDREGGLLFGHVSRQNPQVECFAQEASAVIVFRGPHSYISPTWYTQPAVVPTWNFAAVHVSGSLRAVTGVALEEILAKSVRKFEAVDSPYNFQHLDENVRRGFLAGIVGFQMQIDALEGKFKFGQERIPADRDSILHHLAGIESGPSLADLTAEFYGRLKLPK